MPSSISSTTSSGRFMNFFMRARRYDGSVPRSYRGAAGVYSPDLSLHCGFDDGWRRNGGLDLWIGGDGLKKRFRHAVVGGDGVPDEHREPGPELQSAIDQLEVRLNVGHDEARVHPGFRLAMLLLDLL